MQRVTHCLLQQEKKIFLLNKPRRNWWVCPGGKMESGEHIYEAVQREYYEETNLHLHNPELKVVSTIVVKNDHGEVVNEWMMFSFFASECSGIAKTENHEGYLEWHPCDVVSELAMAEGDRVILQHLLFGKGLLSATFYYNEDYDLLTYHTNDIR
ncbi:MAG: NUDIX hydrolase [Bacilli bacterium]